jgi:2-oxoacid:acceptor oxidoreductase gamma subunit (pyruvate/2-ketoisovalerate family)
MLEIRFHSRGGQGGVIAGKLLAVAFAKEGKFVQTFPSFGVERRAAPVLTFLRVDDKPIRLRTQVYSPDIVIIMDPSLIAFTPVLNGLKPEGIILVNSDKSSSDFPFSEKFKCSIIDASEIALKHGLGSVTQPIINTVILGAFAKCTGLVSLEAVLRAIETEISIKTEANLAAAKEAFANDIRHWTFDA